MLHFSLTPIDDFAALGRRWQALEADASAGFFRSWAFLGCQANIRFANARLLSATRNGQDIALALIGRGAGTSWLNETGNPTADSLFIEHNGLLLRQGHADALVPALQYARQKAAPLTLSGIDTPTLEAAQALGWCSLHQTRHAPQAKLDALQTPFLDTLSANARAQIRRSLRLYGTPALARASTPEQALAWFTEMTTLHQSTWQRRGKPGAFAHPAILDFHITLIASAWHTRNIDLLRIASNGNTIGILYNFIDRGRVSAYQSGFAYTQDPRLKPGLVCHSLAIQTYADQGDTLYDFLAGADRYKNTLADTGENLHWATLEQPWSVRGIKEKASSFLKKSSKKLLRPGVVVENGT